MGVDYNPGQMAIELMKAALGLLDAAGEPLAACELQHAVSIATREAILTAEDVEASHLLATT